MIIEFGDVERRDGKIYGQVVEDVKEETMTQEELEIFMTDLTMLMNKCSSILLEIAGEDQD